MSLRIIVLAAGKGKRMKSEYPKILHEILGIPMISYVLDSISNIPNDGIFVVVSEENELIKDAVGNKGIDFVVQKKQLGTGHAVKVATEKYGNFKGNYLVLNGDLPAIRTSTLRALIRKHEKSGSVFSFISAFLDDPSGYGRVIRDGDNVTGIIEEKDASAGERRINEINSGAYCIDSGFLSENLNNLGVNNRQGEYYLPELINIASSEGYVTYAHAINDHTEILGVNRRKELAEIQNIIRKRINDKHMDKGVTIQDPLSTYISPKAVIGRDCVIYPNTYIYGSTRIGKGCAVGPSAYIENSRIGKNSEIRFSTYLSEVRINDNVTVGPFAHLRPDTIIMDDARIGNFVEIKKSRIGKGSKVPHLSYVGDATLGKNVNIGAGSITCNYDGVNKHRTMIGDGAFIGSDTMMVAPIKIGEGATTAAGSTITRDVEKGSLAIERSKQKEIRDWKKRKAGKKGKD